MRKNKKRIRSIFVRLFARKIFQAIFKNLHLLSSRGMNYGAGPSPYDSGEYFFLQYLRKQFSSKIEIFDIGANVGKYALLADKVLNSNCTIYSFEPTLFSYERLKNNTKEKPNIHPYHLGMGSSKKSAEIYFNSPGSVQASVIDKGNLRKSETINLTTINDFCKEKNIPKINFLKIDVEGFEYDVLLGGSDVIDRIDCIQFEFGKKQISNRNFLRDFIELLHNSKIYRLVQDGIVEIDNDPINEIFQTSNYAAINKTFASQIDHPASRY